jgi:hypothetical protein
MADVDFVEDHAGIAEMLRTPEMVAAMGHLGEIVRIDAEATAAVDTGAYAFGLPGRPGVTGGGFKIDADVVEGVATATVSNDVRRDDFVYALALEFGTDKMPAQHTLGRALDALSRIA